MRAVTFDRYGGPEELRMRDLPVPEPGPGQVRIATRAAGLNPYDWHLYRADPWLVRLAYGPFRPALHVVGADIAGVVDAVGPDVTALEAGDAVYGEIGFGACGEYAVADAAVLAHKPRSLTFTEAAGVPMGALTALQGLDRAEVVPGARVLVLGASGGVGHLAVQIARALGAGRVVAVCSARNADWVRELGADRVVAHERESILDCGEEFDLIYDVIGTVSLWRLRRILARDGAYVPAGGLGGGKLLGPAWTLAAAGIAGPFARRRVVPVSAKPSGPDLARVADWIDAGVVRPRIDTAYALDEHLAAFRHLETQRVAGKVVIEVG